MTHCCPSVDRCNPLFICGRATLTIEMSSTTMNCARQHTASTAQPGTALFVRWSPATGCRLLSRVIVRFLTSESSPYAGAAAPGKWAPANRPVRHAAGAYTGCKCGKVREAGDARVVTADLISRARAGDGDAFGELTEPYLRELRVHCYRMLGSFQDAEDALQNTLLNAWQSLGGFEGRASLRTWLYRIATNRCLDAPRPASRRPAKEWDVFGVEWPEPTRLGEVVWLQPYPDALLEGAIDMSHGTEARYAQTESLSLALLYALHVLTP